MFSVAGCIGRCRVRLRYTIWLLRVMMIEFCTAVYSTRLRLEVCTHTHKHSLAHPHTHTHTHAHTHTHTHTHTHAGHNGIVVLFSNDRNLCAKAMGNGVKAADHTVGGRCLVPVSSCIPYTDTVQGAETSLPSSTQCHTPCSYQGLAS